MSRPAERHRGAPSVVSPAPTLGANGARHRSTGNYAKSYGRSSFELQKAKKPALQPPPQESLKCGDDAATTTEPRVLCQVRSPVGKVRAGAGRVQGGAEVPPRAAGNPSSFSPLHERIDSDEDSDYVSESSSPSQSFLPERRRRPDAVPSPSRHVDPERGYPSSFSGATAADDRLHRLELLSDKENSHLSTSSENNTTITVPAAVVARHRAPQRSASGGSASDAGYQRQQQQVPQQQRTPSPGVTSVSGNRSGITPTKLFRRTASDSRTGATPPSAKQTTPTKPASPASSLSSSIPTRPVTTSRGRGGGAAGAPSGAPVTAKRCNSGRDRTAGAAAAQRPTPSSSPAPALASPAKSTSSVSEDNGQRRSSPEDTPPPPPRASAPAPPSPSEGDWELQMQVDQMQSVLLYVAEVGHSLSERRRCPAPPDSTDGFRASVVPCRRSRGGGALREASHGRGGDDDEDALTDLHWAASSASSPSSATQRSRTSIALLPDLHRAAGGLLSAFTKLEYAQLSEDVDVPLLERESVERSTQLLRLVDAVERQLSLHEVAAVRQLLARRRSLFPEMHRLVDFIARMTQQVVLLRGIAVQHDLSEAREVWEGFKRNVELQESRAAPPRQQPDAATTPLFSPLRMLCDSPFFQWLETRWFPAMQAWRQLVLEAREAARSGGTDLAIRRSRQAVLCISGLQVILRPGETISALHHAEVEVPIQELGRTFAQKRAVMDALQRIVADTETLTLSPLAKAVKAAQAYTRVRSGRDSGDGEAGKADHDANEHDAALVRQAEDLLDQFQETDRLRKALSTVLQQPSPDLVTLLELMTHANELLCVWGHAHDSEAAQAAYESGCAALEHCRPSQQQPQQQRFSGGRYSAESLLLRSSPPPPSERGDASPVWLGDGFPRGFNVHSLYVPHLVRNPWSSELSVLYRELCDVFAMLFMQRQAQRELEQALGLAKPSASTAKAQAASRSNAGGDGDGGFLSLSPQLTPRRRTRDDDDDSDGSPARAQQQQQRSIEEAASPLVIARNSAEGAVMSSPRRHSAAAAAATTADELRRRIQQAEDAGIGGSLVEEARAQLQRLQTLRLKIHFDAQTRVLPIANAAEADFNDVYERLHESCQAQLVQSSSAGGAGAVAGSPSPWAERRLRIRYEDAEGDFISLLNQQDWRMMLGELTPHGCGGGKIELFCDYPIWANMTSPPVQDASEVARFRDGGGNGGGAHAGMSGVESSIFLDDEDSVMQSSSQQHQQQQPDDSNNDEAPVKHPSASAEKKANVFDRLTGAKDGGRGAGLARTPRGRARVGGAALGSSSPSHGLLPRPRSPGVSFGPKRTQSPGKGAAAARHDGAPESPRRRAGTPTDLTTNSSASPSASKNGGTGSVSPQRQRTGAQDASPATKAAELTADNLRRNLFATSPSPPQAEGTSAEKKAGKVEDGAAGANLAAAVAALRDEVSVAVSALTEEEEEDGPLGARFGTTRTFDDTRQSAIPDQPSSVVHLDFEQARRWRDGAADDELSLLEIQTRASMSTARMDHSVSNVSEGLPCASSTAVARPHGQSAEEKRTDGHSTASRNTFTTTHCSGKPTDHDASEKSTSSAGSNSGENSVPVESGKAKPSAPSPSFGSPPRDTESSSAAAKKRSAPSLARNAPRRWNADDFTLDEVETVCSDRSRRLLQPIVPRGPTALPPRPQQTSSTNDASPSGNTDNCSPQRGRRGARGTPTRRRPDGGGEEETKEPSPESVFAEMQRMREENSRAMVHPRKAAWH